MSEALSLGRMSPKGSAADLLEWSQSQHTIGRCAFCPGWEVSGSASEVRELALNHRHEVHPEIKRSRRPRRKGHIALKWHSTMDKEESAEIAETRNKRMKLLGIENVEAAP